MKAKSERVLAAAALAAGLIFASGSARAFPVTINGVTCDSSDLITGPGGGSICPTRLFPDIGLQLARAILGYPPLFEEYKDGSWELDDPSGQAVWTRGNTVNGTSAAGAVAASGCHATDLGAEVDGHLNVSKTFNLAGDQRLYVGLMFNYDNQHAGYDVGGTLRRDIYTATAIGRYEVGSWFAELATNFDWGNCTMTNAATGGVGSFDTRGYQVSGMACTRFS